MNNISNLIEPETLGAAKIIWDYMKMEFIVKPADVMFVLGSRDDRVALYAAQLYKRNISNYVLISGGAAHKNDLLATAWSEKTEAEHFAKVMSDYSVPTTAMILETKATSSGENISFGHQILCKHRITPKSIVLIQKPYMERRTHATFMKQWPGVKNNVIVTSPPISFDDYFNHQQPFDEVINIIVGDMQRIIEYPLRGFQIIQKVPRKVQKAYQYLIKSSYNKHLLHHYN